MKKKSKYDKYFTITKELAVCKQPNCRYKYDRNNTDSTNSLRNHLESKHKALFEELVADEKAKSQAEDKAATKLKTQQNLLKRSIQNEKSKVSETLETSQEKSPVSKQPRLDEFLGNF